MLQIILNRVLVPYFHRYLWILLFTSVANSYIKCGKSRLFCNGMTLFRVSFLITNHIGFNMDADVLV